MAQYAILYRTTSHGSLPFYGSSLSVHFYDYNDFSGAPDVVLEVVYSDSIRATSKASLADTSISGWEPLVINLDSNKRVVEVFLKVGGPYKTVGSVFFDDLSVEGYTPAGDQCSVKPASLDFGELNVGSSADRSFTITNPGAGTIRGTVSENCSHYQIVSGGGDYSLSTNQSRTVTVRYAPSSAGDHPCTISLGSSSPCESVPCTGNTPPVCSITPAELSFGYVDVGQSEDLTFTVKNTGGGTLSGTVDGACGVYSVVASNRNYALAGGDSAVFTVRYSPTDESGDTCSVGTGTLCEALPLRGRGWIQPACEIVPASIDFGTVSIGETGSDTVTIRNSGGGVLAGTIAESCAEFSIAGDPSFSLAGGEAKSFVLQYAPVSTGADSCVFSTGSDDCPDIPVTGRGEDAPACALFPDTLRFGVLAPGDSADLSFTVTNDGGGTLSGTVDPACGPFRVINRDRSYELARGESRSFTVRFAPAVEESASCSLAAGMPCGALVIEGVGYEPPLCFVDPPSIDFGDVPIDSSALTTITIRNNGGGRLAGAISVSCDPFALVGTEPSFDLAGGEEKSFLISFTPSADSAYFCSASAGEACGAIDLAGRGVGNPVCGIYPDTLDFGALEPGDIGSARVTIRNDGTGVLAGTVADRCGPFRVTNTNLSYSLPRGVSKVFTVEFSADTLGARSCSFDIGAPCGALALLASVEPPAECGIVPASIDFGEVIIGESRDTFFTVTNVGGNLLAGEIDLSCGPFSVLGADRSYELGAGESRIFRVRYTPVRSGPATCDLGSGDGCVAVALTGKGRDRCTIAVTSPAGGEVFEDGQVRVIAWDPGVCTGSVSIELLSGGNRCAVIADSTPNDGAFDWTVAPCVEPGDSFRVRIALLGSAGVDALSDSFFSIIGAPGLALPDSSLSADLDPVAVSPTGSREFRIVNRGVRPLHWRARPDAPWISLESDSGEVAPGETLAVRVFLDPESLPGGNHHARILLTTDDPRFPAAGIGVAVKVKQYSKGDVTVNDTVDVTDLARLLDHIMEVAPLFEPIVRIGIADVNDDRSVDVSDLVGLAGILSSTPISAPPGARRTTLSLEAAGGGELIAALPVGMTLPRAGIVEIESDGGAAATGIRVTAEQGVAVLYKAASSGNVARIVFYSTSPIPAKETTNRRRLFRIRSGSLSGGSFAITAGLLVTRDRSGRYEKLVVVRGESPIAPGDIRFFPPSPNPFTRSQALAFSIGREGRVRIVVYDATGRAVRTVEDRVFPPGRHVATWDGLDDRGRRAPNGVYFIVLGSGETRAERKVILLR